MTLDPIRIVKRIASRALRLTVDGRIFRALAPHSPPAEPGKRPQIAICSLISNLGDTVMVFPLLDELRRHHPELEIHLFTSGAGRIVACHPAVDHLYVMDRGSIDRSRLYPASSVFAILRWWRRELRSLRFDTIVVLRGGVDPFHSHHLAWLLGGRERIAYSTTLEPERPEFQFHVSPLFTSEVTEMREVHEVNRGFEVLQLAGLLETPIDLKRTVESLVDLGQSPTAKHYRSTLGLLDRPYAVISPGASVPRRAWPAEQFAELARREFLARGWLPVIVGGADVSAAAETISASFQGNALNLTGKTSFEQLAAICAGAKCFLGNDSGTAHLAGACGVPTLIATAFARSGQPTHHASPRRSHPLGPYVAVVQPESQLAPCVSECIAPEVHCIGQITVDEMQFALRALLRDAGNP